MDKVLYFEIQEKDDNEFELAYQTEENLVFYKVMLYLADHDQPGAKRVKEANLIIYFDDDPEEQTARDSVALRKLNATLPAEYALGNLSHNVKSR